MQKPHRHGCALLASLIVTLVGADLAADQVVRGTITDAASGSPIAGVDVVILSAGRDRAGAASTDAFGAYEFSLESVGEYVVQTEALGYRPLTSPLFTLTASEPVRLDFHLDAEALALEGLEVEVDQLEVVRREYALLGVNLADVGRRLLDPEFVASRWADRDLGELIESRALPGVSVTRSEHGDPPCVALQRGRTGAGMWSCAQVAVDGQLVNRSMLLDLPIEAVSSVLLMTPSEATLVFGTGASGGVIAILTKLRAR